MVVYERHARIAFKDSDHVLIRDLARKNWLLITLKEQLKKKRNTLTFNK